MGPSEKITSQEALVLDGSVIEQDGEDLSQAFVKDGMSQHGLLCEETHKVTDSWLEILGGLL